MLGLDALPSSAQASSALFEGPDRAQVYYSFSVFLSVEELILLLPIYLQRKLVGSMAPGPSICGLCISLVILTTCLYFWWVKLWGESCSHTSCVFYLFTCHYLLLFIDYEGSRYPSNGSLPWVVDTSDSWCHVFGHEQGSMLWQTILCCGDCHLCKKRFTGVMYEVDWEYVKK